MKRDLHFEAVYKHPIEEVWRAITDSRAIEQWLMPNNFEPRVGHKFEFTSKPQPGWDGHTYCEVLECDPPRRLAYTWKGGPIDTVVTIELESVAEGTRLKLAHTGFKGVKALMVAMVMGGGWKGIVNERIPAVLDRMNGGPAAPAESAPAH